MRSFLAAFLITTSLVSGYSHSHMYYKRPEKSSSFSRAMDIRNQEVSRLRLNSPNLSREAVKALADQAADRYLREEAMSSRSHSMATNRVAGNACTGMEANITVENMCMSSFVPTCDSNDRYRTFDGTCNNLGDPLRGATNTKMDRMLRALYRDGEGEPYGSSAFNFRADEDVHEAEDRRGWYWGGTSSDCDKTYPNQLPEPRLVSQTFHRDEDMPDQEIALMLMQFGQFVDHDITLTPEAHTEVDCCEATEEVVENQDCLSIALPPGDPFGENFNLTCLEFRRSTAFCPDCEDVREQFDIISQYVDTSNIYGSDPTFSCQLRSGNDGSLLSQETDAGSEYLPSLGQPPRLTSGDIRALEMPGLASMHTLWLREHNGIAGVIRENMAGLSNEEIFQETRRIVIAQYQNIVYSEFLRSVLGYAKLCQFNLNIDGCTYYDDRVRGVILNEFATAAYRFGHTLIQGTVIPREPSNKMPLDGYQLRNAFFEENQLDESMANGGVDRLLTGIAEQQAQKFDQFITEEVSNFLVFDFGSPRSDLIARNLQRSRDHGLRGYNEYREECGLQKACSWNDPPREISSTKWEELSRLYNHPNDIELFTGGLAEHSVDGGVVGPTFACIIGRQFERLRFGDRFFFTHKDQVASLNSAEFYQITNQKLSDVMCRNIETLNELRENVFDLGSSQLDCEDQSRYIDISVFFNNDTPCMRRSGVRRMNNGPWIWNGNRGNSG